MTAKDAETNGNYEDAVRLYDRAQNFDKAIQLLIKQIGRVLAADDSILPERSQLISLANNFYHRCETYPTEVRKKVKDRTWTTFHQLHVLLDFFAKKNQGEYDQALTVTSLSSFLTLLSLV